MSAEWPGRSPPVLVVLVLNTGLPLCWRHSWCPEPRTVMQVASSHPLHSLSMVLAQAAHLIVGQRSFGERQKFAGRRWERHRWIVLARHTRLSSDFVVGFRSRDGAGDERPANASSILPPGGLRRGMLGARRRLCRLTPRARAGGANARSLQDRMRRARMCVVSHCAIDCLLVL